MDSGEGFEILKCMAPTESELKTAAAGNNVKCSMFFVYRINLDQDPPRLEPKLSSVGTVPSHGSYCIVLCYTIVMYFIST